MGKEAVGADDVGYSDAVTEFKLVLLVVQQGNQSSNEL